MSTKPEQLKATLKAVAGFLAVNKDILETNRALAHTHKLLGGLLNETELAAHPPTIKIAVQLTATSIVHLQAASRQLTRSLKLIGPFINPPAKEKSHVKTRPSVQRHSVRRANGPARSTRQKA